MRRHNLTSSRPISFTASILNKIINTTLLFLPPFFTSWTQRSKTFLWHKKAYFSQILFTNLSKSVLVNEIIHPPHRCSISRYWLDSMIIAQVCLKAKVYFTLYAYARDSIQCAWREFRHQNSTRLLYAHPQIFVTAHTCCRTCALSSLAVISLSTRWKCCRGGGGGGGVLIHKVAEEKLHKHMASHTSGISLDTVRLPKR